METSIILFLVIIGSFFDAGYSKSSKGKLSCEDKSYRTYKIFGRENPKLKYLFYNRNSPNVACDLQPTEVALRKCRFDPNSKTTVIVHGFIPNLTFQSQVFDIKDKLLQTDNFNVVVFNWTAYSRAKEYQVAAFRSFFVGHMLSAWIYFLQVHGADQNDFHLICHSLGTEVCSFASKPLCSLGHITYLDAAGPIFRYLPKFLEPSTANTHFLEAIHTSGALNNKEGFGYLRPIADIDYYPNGGQTQPLCIYGTTVRGATGEPFTVDSYTNQIYCSHDASFTYYIDSFNKTCKFLGRICGSYKDFTSGKCSSAPVCRMGFYSKRLPGLPAHSKCYLETSAKPPFCLN